MVSTTNAQQRNTYISSGVVVLVWRPAAKFA